MGKRKPFIIFGSMFLGFSFFMLYLPGIIYLNLNSFLIILYEFIWLSAIGFTYSALIIPYQAWMPEITTKEERVEVSVYENFFNFAGNIVGIGASFALALLISSNLMIFLNFLLIAMIIEIILYGPAVIFLKDGKPKEVSPELLKEVKIAFRDRNFVNWEVVRGLSGIGVTILTAMVIDLVQGYLHLLSPAHINEGIIVFITVISSIYLIYRLSKKIDIRIMMSISLLVLSLGLIFLIMIDIIHLNTIKTAIGILLVTISIIGLIGFWLFNYVILANIIDLNTMRTGKSRAGLYTGLDNVLQNIFQSIAYVILGFALKYYADISQLIWAPIAGFFTLISFIAFWRLKIEF